MNENSEEMEMEPFLGASRISQAGAFLEAEEGKVLYANEEDQEELKQSVQEHYKELASLAALEHHPGYAKILEYIETLIQVQYDQIDELMIKNEAPEGKLQMNHYAAIQLKLLRKTIISQIGAFKQLEANHAKSE